MFKKLREFDKKYSNLFLGFSFLIIVVFLIYISVVNRNSARECEMPNNSVKNYRNYSYEVTITKNNEFTELYIKRYDYKYLIEKNENGVKSTYYIYYTDILEKSLNGKYIIYREDAIVDGIDNKLLLLDYVNEISLDSTISKDNELTCYNNRKLELSMCINLDKSVSLRKDDYIINYNVKDIGSVSDFNVDVDLSYNNSSNDIIDEDNIQ